MIKKTISVLLFLLIWLANFSTYPQGGKELANPKISDAMEIRTIGGIKVLVPKDAKVWLDGNMLRVEEIYEYTARRLMELGSRLEEAEAALVELQSQIDELRKSK